MNNHLEDLVATSYYESNNRVYLSVQEKRKVSWLMLFVKVPVTVDYSFSSIKMLPRRCYDGKYVVSPSKILLHHLKLRSYSTQRVARTEELFLCAMSCHALVPRLSSALIWTSIRFISNLQSWRNTNIFMHRDTHTLPSEKKRNAIWKKRISRYEKSLISLICNQIAG